ncbi:MAG TPA: isoleucine--tRNA ligase [Vicinamibacterales bacterium]|nr:isoleucine--tRNA ligase [Vicinamibacterales bacterium]
MKANLPVAEPQMLARWNAMNLYGQLRDARAGKPKFVLHDGPPYANGSIHIGTAINKILKELVVKSKSMSGYDAPYVVGFDCHGLPIELKVDKELGAKKRDMSVLEFCRACRAYAERFIGTMTEQFQRLGILGTWDAPYLTMDYRYQAAIARTFGRFVEKGLVYKGKKPVHWCIHCRTALAEAEVEYADHVSPSIYVEFALAPESQAEIAQRVPKLAGRNVSVVIWTTTPWTIPSNLAIAFHPEFDYAAYDLEGRAVIMAEGLASRVAEATGLAFGAPVAKMKGADLEKLRFRHPLYARDSIAVLADYVTLDAGTGAVHTAPGHGADDFTTGQRYGLEIYAPVGPGGHFLESVELFSGQRVFDANASVEQALKERSRLLHRSNFSHQYPHCWRCHNPVIFLATSQWFIRMDGDPAIAADGKTPQTLREAALSAIDSDVKWIPAWGHDRIYNMVSSRPDWCISRQRVWGVPIPAVDCTKCGEAITTPGLVEIAAKVFEAHGADAWYDRPVEDFLPSGLACPSCSGTTFEKEMNILDVWFDSGSSHEAVLSVRPELTWPSDIYLEGSDQHRGWFQSSLLLGLGTRGRPPYRQVVTNGFVIDTDGQKMSKSIGNVIAPQDVINQSGADVLRLWAAMSDYWEDIRVSKEILTRASEAYRKIRNTLRYLIGNLYDFDPSRDRVSIDALEDVDRYILLRYGQVAKQTLAAYDAYDFSTIFQTVNAFTTVDLSAFYADVSKDRLYTFASGSKERRSAQTAMYVIADGLARLLAPILSFTTDELWQYLPGSREESVHLALFPEGVSLDGLDDPALTTRWERLIAVRDQVLAKIEPLRKDKQIGSSLQAKVTLSATGDDLALLRSHEAQLPMLFIVSEVEVREGTQGGGLEISIDRARGVKCERCWRYVANVSADPERPGICDRCQDALAETVPRQARDAVSLPKGVSS